MQFFQKKIKTNGDPIGDIGIKFLSQLQRKSLSISKVSWPNPLINGDLLNLLNLNQSQSTPSYINLNGYIFQSPKLISNIMNDFSTNIVKDIRSEFKAPKWTL